VVIVQSVDVLWSEDGMLQSMVDAVSGQPAGEREVLLPRVKHCLVDPWAFLDPGEFRRVAEDEEAPGYDGRDYQGRRRTPHYPDDHPQWPGENMELYPFLVPFRRADLDGVLRYEEDSRDTHLSGMLRNNGFRPVYRDDLVGVHQAHANKPSVHATLRAQLANWGPQHPEVQGYPPEEMQGYADATIHRVD
jgi:hypothetical protein